MIDHHVPEAGACPKCGRERSGALSMSQPDAPRPGDVSVCADCFAPLIFGDDLRLRLLTDAERKALHPETQRELATVTSFLKTVPR